MTPVVYHGLYGTELHLIAFSTSGTLLANQLVAFQAYQINGSDGSILGDIITMFDNCSLLSGCGFSSSPGLPIQDSQGHAIWPQPGLAIWEYPQGSPWIWVADNIRSTVAYKFDPATGFSEIYRFSDTNNRRSSPPLALDNVVAAVGTEEGHLKFERDNFFLAGLSAITAAPTRMNDGRLVIVNRYGTMFVINGHSVALQQQLNGYSIAAAAASCTHLFVSTTGELVTFDVKTMLPVSRLGWTVGGLNAPVIGPFGHVYVMTNASLLVFAAPKKSPLQTVTTTSTACDQPILSGGSIAVK
jgi:hypothetical protein